MPRIRVLIVAGALAVVALVGCVIYLNPLCTDQILNGDESDVDCGGGTCGRCTLGRSCRSDDDCDDHYCVAGTCTPLPCFNGKLDEGETDVDCGGPTCRKCAGARRCLVDGDCFSGRCDQKACASLRTVTFADAVAYPSGYKSYALFSADFNQDGRIDLAAANEEGSTITVFLNNGDGTFATVPTGFATGEYPTGGAAADFNHDGIPDLVTANYHGNSVSVLLGVGDGTLQPARDYATVAKGQTSNLAVGDLDGDGNLDVVATNPGAGSVSQFMGQADGTLRPAITWPVGIMGAAAPFSAAIADFNGDGKNDVAVGEISSRTIIVRLGNGDGTFGPEVAYRDGGIGAYIVIARDMNLDGNMDIVVANRGTSDVTVLLGRGDGTFHDALVSTTGADTGPYSVAVADFNQDDVPDVATANYTSSTASVLLGIGDGRFEAPIDAGRTGMVSYGVVAADLDADGKPDLAVCNAVSNDVTVKLSTAH